MKISPLPLLATLITFSFIANSTESMTSQQAYDKAQDLRHKANALLKEGALRNELVKAENYLLEALDFVRGADIRAMYSSNKYLEARQWDILRDLLKVNSMQQDEKAAISHLNDLSRSGNGLYWVANDKAVVDFLGNHEVFIKVVEGEKSWSRIQSTNSFGTKFVEELSDAEKLAGLSLLWAEVKQGFVYFDQVPNLNWDKTYKDYISIVLNTKSTFDYYKELTRMVSLLNDGHTNVYYPEELHEKAYARPPLRTKLVDGKVLVTDIYSDSLLQMGLEVGDEVIEIDRTGVHDYAKKNVQPFQSSSTKQDLDVRTYTYGLLSGDKRKPIELLLKSKGGKAKTIIVERGQYGDESYPDAHDFSILANKYGYFRTNSFGSNEAAEFFERIFKDITKLDGLIIDLRSNGGGSSNVGFRILSHLSDKAIIGSKAFVRKGQPIRKAWGYSIPEWEEVENYPYKAEHKEVYSKPVIVLAGAQTFSAAEDFLVAFKELGRGIVIGEKTAGSTGQPLSISLPAGGKARVCVKRDTYQSGEDWVGVGIAPDIEARNTAVDIQNKKDVVIDIAVRQLDNMSLSQQKL